MDKNKVSDLALVGIQRRRSYKKTGQLLPSKSCMYEIWLNIHIFTNKKNKVIEIEE